MKNLKVLPDPDWFYLFIQPQGIRWVLIKYHNKLIGMKKKNTRFSPRALWVSFVFITVYITWTIQRFDIEVKAILENPKITTKAIMITKLRVASQIRIMNMQYHSCDRFYVRIHINIQ